jgi:hypothetical protein
MARTLFYSVPGTGIYFITYVLYRPVLDYLLTEGLKLHTLVKNVKHDTRK